MTRHRSSVSSPVASRSRFWRGLAAILAWVSDRWLPPEHPLTVESLIHRCKQVQQGWQQFRVDHDPGEVQFRGLPFSDQHQVNPPLQTRITPTWFRGCPVSQSVSVPMAQPAQRYIPWYQQRLQTLLARLPLADMDRYSAPPEAERHYRGQIF
ncbi:MAG: hypothetical protein HC921_19550 [Synechococcaceae cyanobacterium SM2_3_1]|nr:hypothetical protein [Synechococcaceae cyanobacterium SM2_3_1]